MKESSELANSTVENSSPQALRARAVNYLRPHHTSRYDDEAWEVKVRLAGVKKEDVRVTVENEVLEIKATRRAEVPETWRPLGDYEKEKHYRLLLDVGPEVDESRIAGSLEDGLLTLRLPLREEVKPRSIEIH